MTSCVANSDFGEEHGGRHRKVARVLSYSTRRKAAPLGKVHGDNHTAHVALELLMLTWVGLHTRVFIDDCFSSNNGSSRTHKQYYGNLYKTSTVTEYQET
ncbi:hypothetical protein NC652_020649 [Populus alba x Populus x berolinensis]|nr:hypothetical protein NC652_020649 [Populus alba x Populus x berolinensis]